MKRNLSWIALFLAAFLIAAGVAGYFLYQRLTTSMQVSVAQGPAAAETTPFPTPLAERKADIARALLAAGLNEQPVFGDTGVSGHMQRLEAGEVSEEELIQYAQDLTYLNSYTAEHGAQIPTDFWDVRTEEMTANSWDEYWIVRQIAIPEAEPYLRLLAQGYGRFKQFKEADDGADDSALDAALDMMQLVDEYYAQVTEEPTDQADMAADKGYADGMLLVWQSLVAGSTRTNPLTNEPMFSHSIFARNNIGTMYQFELDQQMGIAEIWGVSGFAPQFVGTPVNNNQVEHMSISTILQMVLDEPVAVLDGIEEEKVLLGGASSEEANADMALNNAIHKEFVPFFTQDRLGTVERLRCTLKDDC